MRFIVTAKVSVGVTLDDLKEIHGLDIETTDKDEILKEVQEFFSNDEAIFAEVAEQNGEDRISTKVVFAPEK